MSGGSYDYAYIKLAELADAIEQRANARLHGRRMAFAKLLRLCADAAHDIEWVDSCDYAEGGESVSIDKVFAFMDPPDKVVSALVVDSIVLDKIRELLAR